AAITQWLGDPFDTQPTAALDKVDYSFISDNEGGLSTQGYIPTRKDGSIIGQSGTTVGAGVDLGQQSIEGLREMGVTEDIITAVSPYLGKQMSVAQAYLAKNPLTLSSSQAEALTAAV